MIRCTSLQRKNHYKSILTWHFFEIALNNNSCWCVSHITLMLLHACAVEVINVADWAWAWGKQQPPESRAGCDWSRQVTWPGHWPLIERGRVTWPEHWPLIGHTPPSSVLVTASTAAVTRRLGLAEAGSCEAHRDPGIKCPQCHQPPSSSASSSQRPAGMWWHTIRVTSVSGG